jgi:hypothetical protein
MKSLKLLLVLLLVFGVLPFTTVLASAQREDTYLQRLSKELVMGSSLIKKHQFEMGTEISHSTFRQSGAKEKGMSYGIFGVYNYRTSIESVASQIVDVYHFDFHFNYKLADFSGAGTVNNIDNYIVEPRIWFGKDFILNSGSRVTPYVGVGYRYWLDQLGGNPSIGDNAYDRRSQYLYIPVGFEVAVLPADGWELRLNGEYDFLVHGWHTSYISQVPTGVEGVTYPDLKNDQTEGYGLRGSVDLIKRGDKVNFMLSPYVRYWNIKDTDVKTVSNDDVTIWGYEPANTSTEIGARLGVQF